MTARGRDRRWQPGDGDRRCPRARPARHSACEWPASACARTNPASIAAESASADSTALSTSGRWGWGVDVNLVNDILDAGGLTGKADRQLLGVFRLDGAAQRHDAVPGHGKDLACLLGGVEQLGP